MIVATAGHVDHGKTRLVRALTGMDTDRLPEERQRGMTIDLGFAHADAGVAGRIGFIDVPGHVRFVRNMLAGVAGIDHALLVVAADDGPMPQTREHLAILGLLGVPGCSVVLTKTDRVAPARCAQVLAELAGLLDAGPYRGAPMFPVALAGTAGDAASPGVAALQAHLHALQSRLAPQQASGHFRLAVDRSFTSSGAGRVVTGTVLSGRVAVGDPVVLSPHGIALRVRALQVHDQASDQAMAGQRCALNLAGNNLKRAEPARGDWVVAPPAHAPTDRFDARIQLLPAAPQPLGTRQALQLHIGAACVPARVAMLSGTAIEPGRVGDVQLVLAAPAAALRGDRFILRDPTQAATLAGGWVLDPFAPARGRATPARARLRQAWAEPSPAQALAALLAAQPHGLSWPRFTQACNLRDDEAAAVAQGLDLQTLPGDGGPWVVAGRHWQALGDRVVDALARWHADQPGSLGLAEPALTRQLGGHAVQHLMRPLLTQLVQRGLIARDGLTHRLPGHQPALTGTDQALLQRVTDLLRPAGLRPPIVGELVSALGIDPALLGTFLQRMAAHGHLVRVAPNRCYLPQGAADLADLARQLAQASPDAAFDAAAYRDHTGIGRNLTVQVLEFLDREGLTRFDGQRRRMLR
ncbi:MAG: selenocysteine-specific translation elongation factor [Aquabacterium sp.]